LALKHIFFDNDGVLVDSEKLYFEANRQVYAECGFELTEEIYLEFFLKQNIGAWHFIKDLGYKPEQISALQKKRSAIYAESLSHQSLLIPGAKELVSELHGQIPMAIVSSSNEDHFKIIHKETGIPEMMEFILTRPDYKHSKPSPDPYLKALSLSGCAANEALVVEDSLRGLEAAKAAGIPCVVIRSELLAGVKFQGAYKEIESITELKETLEHLL